MKLPILGGGSGLLLLIACTINEIEVPDSPCRRILKANPGRSHVDFEQAETGQLSLFRSFRMVGDSLQFGNDTLVATVEQLYPDAFGYSEQVCPENPLSPDAPGPTSHVLQRLGGNLRPSGYTVLLPYDGFAGLVLRPEGPLLAFRGLRPPEGLDPPLYGRIAGFALAGGTLDTVAVRVEQGSGLRYWIYSAEEGPLATGQVEFDGGIRGWVRAD